MMFWFWTILVIAILLWYILVTVIVAYGGGKDIKEMINKLEKEKNNEQQI